VTLREIVDARKLRFDVEVRDGEHVIGIATHEPRAVHCAQRSPSTSAKGLPRSTSRKPSADSLSLPLRNRTSAGGERRLEYRFSTIPER
jgi:hypothetical protein